MIALIDPRLWLAVIVGIGLSFFSGTQYGKRQAKVKANEAIVAYIPKVQAKQAETSTKIESISNETEKENAELSKRLIAANIELGRLRVKPRCNVPTSTTSASTRNATGETANGINGLGTLEVNLDSVANEIIQLGGDLDASYIRIDELRGLVQVYEKACKVE
jgi:hypothetical protein